MLFAYLPPDLRSTTNSTVPLIGLQGSKLTRYRSFSSLSPSSVLSGVMCSHLLNSAAPCGALEQMAKDNQVVSLRWSGLRHFKHAMGSH